MHPKFFEEEEEETLISPSQFFGETLGPPQNRGQRCFPLAHLYSLNTQKFNFGKSITYL
jgi:hypothetical protein